MNKNYIIGIVVLALLLAVGYLYLGEKEAGLGSAPPGLPSLNSTSSVMTITTSALTIFSDSPFCSSRVISTQDQPIMLAFGEAGDFTVASTTISGSVGLLQPASTTVAYDAGIYGCGRVSAIAGDNVSSEVTVVEYR